MTHHFTTGETHIFEAREVADLLHTVYIRGLKKGRIESSIVIFRWFSSGFLTGAGCVLLYQVIA